MAILTAPLFSFTASGAIAKSIVYFGWKGLNVARKYVIPANPKSDAQVIQRDYLKVAIAAIKVALAHASVTLTSADKSAYSLLGSLKATPRTWLNTVVKIIVDQLVDTLAWAIWSQGVVTPSADTLTFVLRMPTQGGAVPTGGFIWYGTTKSSLGSSLATTPGNLAAGMAITPLVTGTKYYLQYRPDTPASTLGADSGIYYGTPT